MMTITTRNRPLVLLHKCPECTTFALAPVIVEQEQSKQSNSLQQRLSRLRLNSAPPTIVECEGFDPSGSFEETSVFEEDSENEHKKDGEATNRPVKEDDSSSGLSSLDGSPVGRSDSVGSANGGMSVVTTALCATNGESVSTCDVPSIIRQTSPLRHRSLSECGGISNSSLKGILKLRSAVGRSLSECVSVDISSECMFTNDCFISESGDDDDLIRNHSRSDQQLSPLLSPSFKKTVRFNDFVQQSLFQPNSSILAQKRKQERKQRQFQTKMKRKRTNSNNGSEAIFTHFPHQMVTGNGREKLDDRRQGETEKGKSPTFADANESRHKKMAAVEGDKRYAGFIVGRHTIGAVCQTQHLRHESGDSALGDDEGER